MWSRSVPVGEVRRLGDHALLLGVRDAREAGALAGALRKSAPPGVTDVVAGLATVMVALDPGGDPDPELEPDHRGLERWLVEERRSLDPAAALGGTHAAPVTVACAFDGPDLAEVAAQAGCTVERVVELVTATPLTVAVVGFAPGFAYLDGLPDALAGITRRRQPRPVVPAGSVALANGYAAVYPSASPGGWQLIGRTAEPFFDALTPPYARVAPGDRVLFTAQADVAEPAPMARPAPAPADMPTPAVFTVLQPGVRTVLQDGGRRGVAALGVPAAAPGDPTSLALANRLVGNRPDAAALEVTAKGPTLRCLRPAYVAVVGARPELRLGGQPMPVAQVVPVVPGQVLEVGPVRHGLRCYLAVAGGFVGPQLLGSCGTDLLSGLGPGPVAARDHLFAGDVCPPLGDHVPDAHRGELPAGEVVVLRVVPGPHAEWFAPGAFADLASRRFTVQAESNRVGLRLRSSADGPGLRADGGTTELDSQGTVTGAVQIPPDGRPVVLLPDHATMGGYPVLAVVATVDHGRLGQCASGATVQLRPITPAEASAAWIVHRRTMDRAVVGHYPMAVD